MVSDHVCNPVYTAKHKMSVGRGKRGLRPRATARTALRSDIYMFISPLCIHCVQYVRTFVIL